MRWRLICTAVAISAILFVHPTIASTLDITTYGAHPGDAVSDLAAINAALAAAKPGDTVFIPAGNFSINKAVTLKSGVNFAGAGSTSILTFSGTDSTMLKLSGNQNVQIASLTLDGGTSTVGQGITADTSNNLNIHNIQIRNIAGNANFGPQAVYFSTAVTNSTVANNTISNIGTTHQWGAGVRLAWGSSNDQVSSNTISNTGRGGILADDGSNNLIITNNTVTGSGLSLVNGTGMGIEVQNSNQALIQGNSVDHWISLDTSNGSAVRNNKVSDTSGITKLAGLELVASNDVVFTGNNVNGGAQVGISESNNGTQTTSRTYFAHNNISGSTAWGIQVLGGPTGGTNQQYFYANQFMHTASSTGNGFRFNGNDHDIVLDSNTISFNGGAGLEFTGTNVNHLVLVKNSIHDNTGAPLTSAFNGTDVVWNGNTVANNGAGASAPVNTGSVSNDPQMTITIPTDIKAGVSAPFDITFTPGATAAPLTNVLWDFGDGLPVASTGPSTSFAFSTAGTYTVGVVAWDSNGRAAQAEATLTVAVPDPAVIPEPITIGFASLALLLFPRRRRA